jgi:hypothetical protein
MTNLLLTMLDRSACSWRNWATAPAESSRFIVTGLEPTGIIRLTGFSTLSHTARKFSNPR